MNDAPVPTPEQQAQGIVGEVARRRMFKIRMMVIVSLVLVLGPTIYSSIYTPLPVMNKGAAAIAGFIMLFTAIIWKSQLKDLVENGVLRQKAYEIIEKENS